MHARAFLYSMEAEHAAETLSTMRFGERSDTIVTPPYRPIPGNV